MERYRYFLKCLVVSLFSGLCCTSICAQDTRAQVNGRVQDSSGAAIVGVKVHATNTATNVETSAVTNENGEYVLPFLLSGGYRVSAEHPGFKTFVQEGITLRVADKVEVNITLEVGQASEQISVHAEAPLVDSNSASLGQVIDNLRVTELPLKDGNAIMLASMAPGVMNLNNTGNTRPFDNSSPSAISINGTRSGFNDFTLDGAPNTESKYVAYVPPSDIVQEFKIQTATFDASQGFTPGGTINVSLKSGTNGLHGSAYEFLQNPALNANKFFSNKAGLPRAIIRLNRWGATATGPVNIPKLYKGANRTFWTYGYEGIHSTDPEGTYTTSVPTAAERQGDFSALLKIGPQYQIYDPATITAVGNGRYSRQPFVGNIIPPNRINPTAKALASYWPQPNQPGTIDGSNNWTTPQPEWDHFYSHVFRVDHNIRENDRFFVRGYVNNRLNEYEDRFGDADGAFFYRKNYGLAVDEIHVFSPSFLMNVRYSYTRFVEGNVPVNQGLDLTALGFSSNFENQVVQIGTGPPKFPDITVGSYGALGIHTLSWRRDDIHAAAVNFTRLVRTHELRFGSEVRVYRETSTSPGQSSGQFDFGTGWTQGPLDSSAAAPTGQTLASFLLGLPTSGGIDVNDSYAEQTPEWALFIHDDWKVSRKLTLNLGLRYELEFPTTERYNRSVAGFDSTTASPIQSTVLANYAQNPVPQVPLSAFHVVGGLTFAGVNGNPRGLWQSNKKDFMPRIGLAYQLDRNTVIRAGYGIFYDQLGIMRTNVNQSGFNLNTQFTPTLTNGVNFIANITDPFPQGIARPIGSALGLMTFAGKSITPFNTSLENPYAQRWQFGIQRALAHETMLEVAYVGNRGTHIQVPRQLDPIPRQYLSTSPSRDQTTINFLSAAVPNPFYPLLPATSLSGTTVPLSQLLRQYPQYTSVLVNNNQGFSWYHSLQTQLQKRFSAGYTFSAAWTWSKFMEATSFLNETDPIPTRAISDLDRTHRIVVNAVYELPFGKGKPFFSGASGLGGKFVSGWQTSAIFQWQSGPPLGFGNAILTGSLDSVALPADQRTVERWFNTAAFDTKSQDQLASNIITLPLRFSGIRGAPANNWDFSVFKNTFLREGLELQFRMDMANALNHPQFAAPNTTPTSSAFGTVTSETQWPRTIQFSLKLRF